ncbi:MAG: ABC transporter permease [Chloroflexota bacterium]|nr:ABC transporter permease [Chloroflexota bacterium]
MANLVVYVLLLAPLVVVLALSFTSGGGVDFPPRGLSLRWFQYIASRPEFVTSAGNSVVLAVVSTVLALILGVMASLGMVRYRFPGKEMVEMLFLAPLVVPSLIIGIALLQFFSIIGFMDSFQRLVLGHVLLTIPYTIRSVSATMYSLDPSLEEASRVMGAGSLRTFWRVVLPMLRPGIVVACLFAFIISFDNFNVSIFLIAANTVTLPVRIFAYLQFQFDPSVAAISTVLLVGTVAILALAERTIGLTRLPSLAT